MLYDMYIVPIKNIFKRKVQIIFWKKKIKRSPCIYIYVCVRTYIRHGRVTAVVVFVSSIVPQTMKCSSVRWRDIRGEGIRLFIFSPSNFTYTPVFQNYYRHYHIQPIVKHINYF